MSDLHARALRPVGFFLLTLLAIFLIHTVQVSAAPSRQEGDDPIPTEIPLEDLFAPTPMPTPSPTEEPSLGLQSFSAAEPSTDLIIEATEEEAYQPAVAFNPERGVFLTAWQTRVGAEPTDVYLRYLSSTGQPLTLPIKVLDQIEGPVELKLGAGGDSFLLVWREGSDKESARLYSQALNGNVDPSPKLGQAQLISEPIGGQFDVAYRDVADGGQGNYVVVFITGDHPALAGLRRGEVKGTSITPEGTLNGDLTTIISASTSPRTSEVLRSPVMTVDLSLAFNPERDEFFLTYGVYDCTTILCIYREDIRGILITGDALSQNSSLKLVADNIPGIQWSQRVVYNPELREYVVIWADNRYNEFDFDLVFQRHTRFAGRITGNIFLLYEDSSETEPEMVWLAGDDPLPEYALVYQEEPIPGGTFARGALLDNEVDLVDQPFALSDDQFSEQFEPGIAKSNANPSSWLAVWEHARPLQDRNLRGRLFDATIPQVEVLGPNNWAMVLSLRPTFRWQGIPEADQYRLTIYLAGGDAENPSLIRTVKQTELPADSIECETMEGDLICSFKPEFPHSGETDRGFELSSLLPAVADPSGSFDPWTDSPQADGLLGYYWSIESVEDGVTTFQGSGTFQIPPLRTWASISDRSSNTDPKTNPCLTYAYCRDLPGYQGGYWNAFDDSFYRWGEAFDVNPSVLKAIAYGETLTGIGPRFLGNDWFSPERAFLYEPKEDFDHFASDCKEDCLRYSIRGGYVPSLDPYEPEVILPSDASIWEVGNRRDISNWASLRSISGCATLGEGCESRLDARLAEYSGMASYGLDQVLFFGVWPTLKNLELGNLRPPEDLYDGDYAVKASSAVLGFDKRCRVLREGGSLATSSDSYALWAPIVGKYNRRPDYRNSIVGLRHSHVLPESLVSGVQELIYERGHADQIEDLVTSLVGYGCETNTPAYRSAFIAYMDQAGYAGLAGSARLASSMQSIIPAEGVFRELGSLDADLMGNGELIHVVWGVLAGAEQAKAGEVRVYASASRNQLLWKSHPIASNVLDAAYGKVVATAEGAGTAVQLDWYEGLHSSSTYILRWDGVSFGFADIFGPEEAVLDGLFSDGGGVSFLDDGSLYVMSQTYEHFSERLIDIYIPANGSYFHERQYVLDPLVQDNEPPASSLSIIPPVNSAGWTNPPTEVLLSADDNDVVWGISYELLGNDRIEEMTSPYAEISFELEEGRWQLNYSAIDVAGNREEWNSDTIMIDGTAPSTQHQSIGQAGENGWYLSDVEFILESEDPVLADGSAGSGVAAIEFSIDDGENWAVYDISIAIEGEGIHRILYRSTDVAGNQEQANEAIVRIDKNVPELTITSMPDILWPPDRKPVDVEAFAEAADQVSGIYQVSIVLLDEYGEYDRILVEKQVEGDAVWAWDAIIELIASRQGQDRDGREYKFLLSARDIAGNESTAQSITLVPHDLGEDGS